MERAIVCDFCGCKNGAGARNCVECGRELAGQAGPVQTQRIVAETVAIERAATGRDSARCDYCGALNPAGAVACMECRRALGAVAVAPCPTCGRPNPTGGRFCRHCGRALDSRQPVGAPPAAVVPPAASRADDSRLWRFVAASGTVFLLAGIIYSLLTLLGG